MTHRRGARVRRSNLDRETPRVDVPGALHGNRMPPLFTVTGRDVLFAHWPMDPDALSGHVPDALTLETFDGTAWVSVLALENGAVGVGPTTPPASVGATPQLNLRTYVTMDGDSGVYFLSLDTGRRVAALAGRRGFGLPFHHATMRLTRRDGRITFRSRRRGGATPAAHFGARYHPVGPVFEADPGTIESFCVERFRFFFPAGEDRRVDALQAGDGNHGGVRVGTVSREPWELRPVEAEIRRNTLFEAAGLPRPTTEPVVQYSPGFQMGVDPLETRDAADRRSG